MRGYLGIDIGTTNTKALLIGEDGRALWSASEPTPHIREDGVEYFDLQALEGIVDDFTEGAKQFCQLKGEAFSSVGESVVPVADGKALGNPLMWYEEKARQSDDEGEILKKYALCEKTGLGYSNYYSAGKILWMRRRMERPARYWLPLTTYMVWRKTGCVSWDNSQACRSYLYDIHARDWIYPLLEELSLKAPGTLDYMGACCGEKDGVTYGLGGHDHMTGLHALYDLQGHQPLFYDSMGTSNVLALLADVSGERLSQCGAYGVPGGCVVAGYRAGEYILTRSFRHYGSLLATLMDLGGGRDYDKVNRLIEKEMASPVSAMFANYADLILGYRGGDVLNLLSVKPGATLPELVRSAYLYLSAIGALQYRQLLKAGREGLPYYAGGGIVSNELLMQVKATALEREITLLDVREIGALGAALIAARVSGDTQAIDLAARTHIHGRAVAPREEWLSGIREIRDQYDHLRDRLSTMEIG